MTDADERIHHLTLALAEARKSPPKPTNFRVGAVLLTPSAAAAKYEITTGYTLELEGNTHAEQCCFSKYLSAHTHLPTGSILYTTMEPCNKRSPGNRPCVERILGLKDAEGGLAIRRVYVGVLEPETFVGVNEGRKRLEDAGVEVVKVQCGEEMEAKILDVATAGHEKDNNDG